MITVIFMYAVLAFAFTAAKAALSYSTPYFLIGFRMILAGLIFLSLQYVFNRKHFYLKKEDVWPFIKVSFFYIYLAFIPEFWALQKLSSSKTVIIFSITPFIVAILAYFLANERFSPKKIFGMAIGFLGSIPIFLAQDSPMEKASEFFFISAREAALLVAVFSGAYAWFLIKKLMDKGYRLPMINGITMLTGGVAAMLTSFAVEGITLANVYDVKHFLFWVLVLIVIANGIYYNLYGWHLRRYSFTLLSFAGFLTPIFGSFFGWLVLSEPLTWHHFASLGFITVGLFFFYQDELKKR